MKIGCLILTAVIALSFFGYQQLLNGTELESKWWVSLLLALSATMLAANAFGIVQSIFQIFASKRGRSQWKDGDLVVVSGRIQALTEPLIGPISGKPSTIVEYDVFRISRSKDSSTSIVDYRGLLMAPCAIQSKEGQLQIIGFPLLTYISPENYNQQESYQRIAEFLSKTPSSPMSKSPVAALAELNKILKDDDGNVQAHYRSSNALNLYQAEGLELEKLEGQESQSQVDQVLNYLKSCDYHLKETTIENGSEVTVMGSYRSQRRQIDIGSGLSNLSHGIYRGSSSKVLGRNLFKAIFLTGLFLAIFLGANYYVLKQIGITPQDLLEYLQAWYQSFSQDKQP